MVRDCEGGDRAAAGAALGRLGPSLVPSQRDLSWVRGLCAEAAGRWADATDAFRGVEGAPGPLAGEASYRLGRAQGKLGRTEAAIAALARVPAQDARRADAVLDVILLGSTAPPGGTVLSDVEGWLANWGPHPRRPEALLLAAERRSAGGEADASRAGAWLDELYADWPGVPQEARAAAIRSRLPAAGSAPGPESVLRRAELLEERVDHDGALALIRGQTAGWGVEPGDRACRAHFVAGRALHRKREYTAALGAWDEALAACGPGDLRTRSRWLRAQALVRSGEKVAGRQAWRDLAREDPTHRLADDALVLAAAVSLDLAEVPAAEADLRAVLDGFPSGDMRGEAAWQLAWLRYRAGDGAAGASLLGALAGQPETSRDLRLRARYWAARMSGWPRLLVPPGSAPAADPSRGPATTPTDDRAPAAAALARLACDAPLSWYGALAAAMVRAQDRWAERCLEVGLAQERETLRGARLPAGWPVEAAFAADPRVAAAREWERLGFLGAARAAWMAAWQAHSGAGAGDGPWLGTRMLVASRLEAAGDFHASHDLMRQWLKASHPERACGWGWAPLRLAYPDAFAAELDAAVAGGSCPRRAFQALVREESGFDPQVVSWAGALGLSQLMWPTARRVATRTGLRLAGPDGLKDPDTNLRIGATYLQGLLDRYRGNLPLAIAAYNAGEAAVDRWVRERPGLPLDAWVEEIPYQQTREYVERVVGSWQTYHYLAGEGDPFVALPAGLPPVLGSPR